MSAFDSFLLGRQARQRAGMSLVEILMGLAIGAILFLALATAINAGGYYNGIRLCGKVKIVQYHADIKVEVVNSFPDLKVKVVEHFPDRIGEWQFVEYGQDFTVQFVNSFPDIKIKYVDSFPGVN